ncbi:MAG: hypothetical protein GY725_14810 [bacterium]|nr:hypothetical protein [bacterium]
MTAAKLRQLTSPAESNPYTSLSRDEHRELLAQDPKHIERANYPYRLSAIQARRVAALSGDLTALYGALTACQFPAEPGSRYTREDLRLNPDLHPHEIMCEIPRWLLDETLGTIWKGLQNKWPKPNPGQRRMARRCANARKDVERAIAVLEAREEGHRSGDEYEYVSRTMSKAGRPSTVRDAYRKVMTNLEDDPSYYRRMNIFPPSRMKIDYSRGEYPVMSWPITDPDCHYE